ncbi:MAG: hypothetical protein AAF213_12795, partial [Pseudomonadota bacterium]
SGVHTMIILQPGDDLMGIPYEDFKNAGCGAVDLDQDRKTAKIVRVYDREKMMEEVAIERQNDKPTNTRAYDN